MLTLALATSLKSAGPWPQNYRVVQLEGVYDAHQVQLPEDFRATQKLKHIIEDIIQNAS